LGARLLGLELFKVEVETEGLAFREEVDCGDLKIVGDEERRIFGELEVLELEDPEVGGTIEWEGGEGSIKLIIGIGEGLISGLTSGEGDGEESEEEKRDQDLVPWVLRALVLALLLLLVFNFSFNGGEFSNILNF